MGAGDASLRFISNLRGSEGDNSRVTGHDPMDVEISGVADPPERVTFPAARRRIVPG